MKVQWNYSNCKLCTEYFSFRSIKETAFLYKVQFTKEDQYKLILEQLWSNYQSNWKYKVKYRKIQIINSRVPGDHSVIA